MDAHVVEVEAHLAASVPGFTLVGLPDASLAEARDRVRAAMTSSGLGWPQRRITVNLSPAGLPKAGPGFDLAIAVATLAGAGVCDPESVAAQVHLGELGLDGRLRPVRGVLPAVVAAVQAGRHRVVVPAGNVDEARLVPGAQVAGAVSLAQVAAAHGAQVEVPAVDPVDPPRSPEDTPGGCDLTDVVGQATGRWALEVTAAGGHHLALIGPPGSGKTMLASRLPGLLPDLDDAAAVEVTAVHSIAGTLDPGTGLMRRPPFEAPHHTASAASVVGGGAGIPRPGAISRAHRGVLFLDEAPEFAPAVLQTLRQPLESGELRLHRAAGTARYPARVQLVLAANPCPCGNAVGKALDCTCTALARRRYLSRLSGPLLDRVDLQLDVLPATRAERRAGARESSAVVAHRVALARDRARARFQGTGWSTNSEAPGAWLRAHPPAGSAVRDLERALDRGLLTMRGADRVLRVAWTLADLAGAGRPEQDHVAQALALRSRTAGPT
ncbi:YifB family Mg chelatase-like AAA ATPase [Cellulomonas bogoriensis]|nr:YifB family Mg chelatase-like AAA ATPase [Cellulomonas bogoriensis]